MRLPKLTASLYDTKLDYAAKRSIRIALAAFHSFYPAILIVDKPVPAPYKGRPWGMLGTRPGNSAILERFYRLELAKIDSAKRRPRGKTASGCGEGEPDTGTITSHFVASKTAASYSIC